MATGKINVEIVTEKYLKDSLDCLVKTDMMKAVDVFDKDYTGKILTLFIECENVWRHAVGMPQLVVEKDEDEEDE